MVMLFSTTLILHCALIATVSSFQLKFQQSLARTIQFKGSTYCRNVETNVRHLNICKYQGSHLVMKDYPKPNVENTDNYRAAEKLSSKFKELKYRFVHIRILHGTV